MFNCFTACACDAVGSLDTVCNPISGQCPCKVGKAGRTCNVCDFMYEYNNSSGQCVCEYEFCIWLSIKLNAQWQFAFIVISEI